MPSLKVTKDLYYEFPDICATCGESTAAKFKLQELVTTSAGTVLVVSWIENTKMEIEVPLCEKHQGSAKSGRMKYLAVVIGLVLLPLVGMLVGSLLPKPAGDYIGNGFMYLAIPCWVGAIVGRLFRHKFLEIDLKEAYGGFKLYFRSQDFADKAKQHKIG